MTGDPAEERARRLAHLLALEVARVVHALEDRRSMIVRVWSRHRSREPLLDALFTRWRTVGLPELAMVAPEAVEPLEAFHRQVADLVTYARYTEDMPVTLSDTLEEAAAELRELAMDVLDALDEPGLLHPPREGGLRPVLSLTAEE